VNPDSGQLILSFSRFDFSVVQIDDGLQTASAGRHSGPIVFLSCSGSPQKLISASMDGSIGIWDPSGRRLHLLQEHRCPIVNASLSGDGRSLATFAASGIGFLWNVDDGRRIRELPRHLDAVHSVHFFRDGKSLLTASRSSGVRIFDLIAAAEKTVPSDSQIVSADVSPDGHWLLMIVSVMTEAGAPSKAILRNMETDSNLVLPTEGTLKMAEFRPAGGSVVRGGHPEGV